MKNQKPETMCKHSLVGSINFYTVSGIVVTKAEIKKTKAKRLCARIRIRICDKTYVDLYGFDDVAKEIDLVCKLGNMIYAEAHLSNKIYVNKKGQKKAKMYFVIENIELLLKSKNSNISEDVIDIIDELDPESYLGEKIWG